MAMERSDDFKTPDCRLAYAYTLFKPRSAEDGKDPKYGCTLIFENADRPALEKYVAEVIQKQWGPAGMERAKKGLIRSPFLAGDGKEAHSTKTGDLHPGMGPGLFFIRPTANKDRQPGVSASPTAFVPATEKEVYSGCYGFAVLNVYAWSNPKNGDGVSFGIQHFFKRKDGEPLGSAGGGSNPDKWVEAVENTGAAPASTTSGQGAGGLFG